MLIKCGNSEKTEDLHIKMLLSHSKLSHYRSCPQTEKQVSEIFRGKILQMQNFTATDCHINTIMVSGCLLVHLYGTIIV